MFSNGKKWTFEFEKIKKNQMRAPLADFFLILICFHVQNIFVSTLEHIHKLPKIKEYGLKSKSDWYGETKVVCWRIFHHV